MYMLEHSYVSLVGTLLLLMASYLFIPSKMSRKRRLMIGVLHVSAHMTAALILMLLLELGIETCIRHGLLATSGIILSLFSPTTHPTRIFFPPLAFVSLFFLIIIHSLSLSCESNASCSLVQRASALSVILYAQSHF